MDTIISRNPSDTMEIGGRYALSLVPGDIVGLVGDLGAGKTHFAKGIAAALGVTDRIQSPTFALCHQYHSGRIPLNHLDLYRLETTAQLLSAGLDEVMFSRDAITIVEWFERWRELAPARLQMPVKLVEFTTGADETRTIIFHDPCP